MASPSVVYNRTYAKTEDFLSGRGAGLNTSSGPPHPGGIVGCPGAPHARILDALDQGGLAPPIDAMTRHALAVASRRRPCVLIDGWQLPSTT